MASDTIMTTHRVIVAIKNWLGGIKSAITVFFESDGFKNFLSCIATRSEAAVQWFADAVGRLVDAIIKFIGSDGFKNGVERCKQIVLTASKEFLNGIRWVIGWTIGWAHKMATSETARNALATATGLLNRYLPKREQQALALASIVIIAFLLVLWTSDSKQTEPLPELTKTTPEKSKTAPEVTLMKSGIPDFEMIPAGRERKAAFFGYFLPLVNDQNQSIEKTRQKLNDWNSKRDNISSQGAIEISKIATRYRMTDFDISNDENWEKLLNRVDVVPASLALAQAANESAWGTSRFARKAYNFFGQWCFKKGCGLVPKKRDANKTHEVAAFSSPNDSVKMYIRNLNSNSAYKDLRDIRARLRDSNKPITGHKLAAGLERYSERGTEYIDELRAMIEFNELTDYDTF